MITYQLSVSPSKIRGSTPVCRVFWDIPGKDDALVVTSRGESYLASYVVSTIPVTPLQKRHKSTFFPSLPKNMIDALGVSF